MTGNIDSPGQEALAGLLMVMASVGASGLGLLVVNGQGTVPGLTLWVASACLLAVGNIMLMHGLLRWRDS